MKRELYGDSPKPDRSKASRIDMSIESIIDPRQIESLQKIEKELGIPFDAIIRASLWLLLSYVAAAPALVVSAFKNESKVEGKIKTKKSIEGADAPAEIEVERKKVKKGGNSTSTKKVRAVKGGKLRTEETDV